MLLAAAVATGCGSQGATPQAAAPVGTSEAALVPPPPVNQNLGIPDTSITEFTAQTCVGCHGAATSTQPVCTDAAQRCPQIADRHHALLAEPGNTFGCLTCHATAPGSPGGISVLVDCMQCHTGPSPHHTTPSALAAHCTDCHGNLVNNYDDGHFIPTSAPSLITPGVGLSGCKVLSGTGPDQTCVAGSCTACHQAAPATTTTPAIFSNADTHHGTMLGQIPGTGCDWCHSGPSLLNIRTCERCHGPSSLHSIQFNPAETTGTAGYGHVGTDQDCWGCHGFFARTFDVPPDAGPTVPLIQSVETDGALRTGRATLIRVHGVSLVNTVKNADGSSTTYSPLVALTQSNANGDIDTIRVIPSGEVTETTLLAQIPADLEAGNWDLRIAKDPSGAKQTLSNKFSLAILPRVEIASATAQGTDVTVSGQGFGNSAVSVAVDGAACGSVASWTNSEVKATCANAAAGATVSVTGVYNAGAAVTATLR
jgi:hypothetical protein